ncbi:MAG TPA: DUF2171 domain-containing protein [Sphingomicrobium sp.]
MAYDRYDTRDSSRDERSRWREDREMGRSADRGWRGEDRGGGGGRHEERGFFERAGDQIASWFGDEEAERRRHEDQMRDEQSERGSRRGWGSPDRDRDYNRSTHSDRDRGYSGWMSSDRDRDWNRERSSGDRYEGRNQNRGLFSSGGSSERDYDRGWRDEFSGQGRRIERNEERDRWVEENNRDFGRHSTAHRGGSADFGRSSGESRGESFRDRDQDMQRGYRQDYDYDRSRGQGSSGGYRPMTGDYGRQSDSDRGMSGSMGGGMTGLRDDRSNRSQSNWERDEYRETSRAGTANKSDRSREDRFDPHYRNWRDRHLSEIDRDYDDYRAENQSRFASDFGSWRERREQKRGLLAQIREHMEVVGSDKKHVGTVDKTAGDRLILTKSDEESGGIHHSISCSDIERVEGDKVILGCSADDARNRWRDESRGRALFERDDQGEMGPRMLDRSFEGTYR